MPSDDKNIVEFPNKAKEEPKEWEKEQASKGKKAT